MISVNEIMATLLAFIVGFLFGGGIFYKMAKRSLLNILKAHRDNGMSFDLALEYEQDVLEGRVPRV